MLFFFSFPFHRPDHLSCHVKHVHSTERPFKCQVTVRGHSVPVVLKRALALVLLGMIVRSLSFQWALVVLVVTADQKVYWHGFFKWSDSRRIGDLKCSRSILSMLKLNITYSTTYILHTAPLNTVDGIFLLCG